MLFCHLFSLPHICLCPDCINICPLCLGLNSCCVSSFPSYFQHLFSILLLVSLPCLCSTQSAPPGCWLSCCRLPGFSDTKHTKFCSHFQLQLVCTVEQDMRRHVFHVLVKHCYILLSWLISLSSHTSICLFCSLLQM